MIGKKKKVILLINNSAHKTLLFIIVSKSYFKLQILIFNQKEYRN